MNDSEQIRLAYFKCSNKEESSALISSCSSSDIFISMHDENAKYLSVSANVLQIAGHNPEELIGNTGYDYFHPEDYKDIFMSHAKTTIKDGVSTVSYRYRKSDGTYLSVVSSSKQLTTADGEKFILALTVLA